MLPPNLAQPPQAQVQLQPLPLPVAPAASNNSTHDEQDKPQRWAEMLQAYECQQQEIMMLTQDLVSEEPMSPCLSIC